MEKEKQETSTPLNEEENSTLNEEEPTSESKSPEDLLKEKEAELSALQKQTIELQKQKEHWRDKYERDVEKDEPSPSSEPEEEPEDSDKVAKLEKELASFKKGYEKERVFAQHPQLKDKQEEFDEFQEGYPGVTLDKLAKLFLQEKGLLESVPQRKGLETPTAGKKTPSPSGMSVEDVKRLRIKDPRRWEELARKGKLNIK